ncbi:rhodanese-like domain-containing protein [Mastigocoleus testarum]|uniref:Rhodanese domain-containing protein n=1 Tax=Mastigocoleus testarum BC008 TaxID=371196 RepID=A0A0V7ZD29_9CYAN|nr:rhodanese-like domain-containing protein [Mastigocoleus testarum]KST62182.1 hypothetical protein BC008_37695 [Mastigocoleus testarum BC008]KST64812.1 hypothetical protein BC008_18525 [Mastigocoleus testarum BC008]
MLPSWRRLTLNLLQFLIKLNFPQVKPLTTQELDLWLKDPDKSDPLLIDARHIEEYELSHLKTAELFTSVQDLLEDVTCHVSTLDTPIVVYCSIGYRSADVANSLVKAGFSRVFNLSGGIFQWVNEEKPVFQKNQLVKSVHPYNKLWGKLLKPEYRNSL